MIEFFKPVDAAWMRMDRCLFKPFELGKWFVLGFTAWLASFIAGGGSNFYSGNQGSSAPSDARLEHELVEMGDKLLGFGLPVWLGILALVAVIIICISLVLIWVSCRGQFMFLDNVIHNRAEVVKPWKEFRSLGNSLFLFYASISFVALLVIFGFIGAVLIRFWHEMVAHKAESFGVYLPWILALLGLVLIGLLGSIFLFYVREFGIPLMYRHRYGVMEAVKKVWNLGCANPLSFFVYLLLRMVMGVLFTILACVAGCLTCCLGFLPYLSTVLTLPLLVFRLSYTLECLSQLTGDDFWPAPEPPPLLEPPACGP